MAKAPLYRTVTKVVLKLNALRLAGHEDANRTVTKVVLKPVNSPANKHCIV